MSSSTPAVHLPSTHRSFNLPSSPTSTTTLPVIILLVLCVRRVRLSVCVCLVELYAGEFQYASSPPPAYTSLVQSPIITHHHYDTPSHHTAGAPAPPAAATDALGGGGCSESSAPVDVDGPAAPAAMRAGGWSNPPSYRSRDPAARPLSQSALTPPPRYHHSPGSPGSPVDDDELTAVSPAASASS